MNGQPQFALTVLRPTLTQQAVNTALIGAYIGYLILRRRLPGPTKLDWPIAALILVYAAAILTSIYPRVSLEASLPIAMALVAFYAFHDFDFLRPAVIVRGLAAVGAIAGAFALVQVIENYLDWLALVRAVEGGVGSSLIPPAIPRVTGVGDNVNVLAMALNLTLPFALALVLAPERRFERAAGILAALVILAALFFTLSRGAWLGTVAALGAFALLYAVRGFEIDRLSRLRARIPTKLAIACALALVLILGAGIVGLSSWESRPEWLFRPSLGPRYDALDVGLQIVRDRPWLGSGPYTFPLLYNVYSGEYPVENIHPHNGYVNVLVDIGIIGALVLLAAGILLLREVYAAYRSATGASRVIVAAAIASLASLAVHSLADSPNVWTTSLLPLAAVLALCLRFDDAVPAAAESHMPRTAPRWLVAALPLLMLGLWLRFDLAHISFDASVHRLAEGNFVDAAASAKDAADADGSSAAYHMNEGVNLAILHLISADTGIQPDPALLANAESALERTVQLEPRGGVGHANLALIRLLQNDREGAAEEARIALGRSPTDGTVAVVAGTVLEWAGFADEAAYAYGIAVWRDPALLQSPFWSANPRRVELRAAAMVTSGLTACELGRVTALFAGFPDDLDRFAADCRDLVDRSPADARARADLAVILTALERDAEALEAAEIAVSQVPDNPFIRTSLGVALIGTGDIDRVRRELVRASHLGDPDATLLLTYTYEPPSSSSPIISRMEGVAEPASLPKPVLERLRVALPASAPMVFDNGIQRYTLGVLYYRVRFLRESPTSIMVPGDWLNFASPRTLLIADALEKH